MAKWGGRIESPLYYVVTNCTDGFHCFVKKGFSLIYHSLQAHAGIIGKYGISYNFFLFNPSGFCRYEWVLMCISSGE